MSNMSLQCSQANKPDHLYVDCNLYNNTYTLGPNYKPQYIKAVVGQTRDTPFLDNPEEWNVTICRFSIDSSYVSRIHQDPGSTGTTAGTQWWVSLSYNGQYYDQPIVIPTANNENGEPEKFENSIFGFLDLVNNAYGTSQAALISNGGPTGLGQVNMTYDPNSHLYYMNVPSWYGTGSSGSTGNGIGVHQSYFLYNKFQSFDVVQAYPLTYGTHDITFNRVWRYDNLVTNLYSNVSNAGTGTTGVYMRLNQDAAWGSAGMDNNRLIITTGTLPIVSEYRNIQNFIPSASTAPTNNQTLKVLTDFQIGKDLEIQSLGQNYLYVPQLYRLVSLVGSSPLRTWDIEISVSDSSGATYPLYISPGGSLDVKLLFIKKGLSS